VADALAQPLVVSHRGSTSEFPENTLAAFDWAQRVGADLIEADLRVSRDGHIVIMHDRWVDRTTNGRGRVHRLSLDDLRALDAGSGQSVPTLHETLTFVRSTDLRLLLDVKDDRRIAPEALVSIIAASGMDDRVVVGSRSPRMIGAIEQLKPELRTLAFIRSRSALERFVQLDVDVVRIWAGWTVSDPSLVETVRASGVEVWVNSGRWRGSRLQSLAVPGVGGLITDYPEEARLLW